VNEHKTESWFIQFAPFAHGLIRGRDLLISSRAGKAFDQDIYDRMPLGELPVLQRRVASDIARLGRVAMAP
jgi:hypothetical protein